MHDDIVSILPENEKVQQFSDYILKTYIKPDCDYPPSVWAMYSCSIIRTTNSCEAFHSKFNSLFYSAHPNILHVLHQKHIISWKIKYDCSLFIYNNI